MSENSKIEWTDHTWSPWEGCQKVGPGCDHCYAEARNSRFGGGQAVNWGPGAPRRLMSDAYWKQPIKWNAQAAASGVRQRVFPSLCDPFDNAVDVHLRRKFFDLIELTPWLTWLLLTKRIRNAFAMLSDARSHDWLAGQDNIWIGATVVNQEEADRDIPKLLALPARVRFLSVEPMLGQINLRRHLWKCCGNLVPGHPGDGWMQPPDPPECCGEPDPVDMLHWVIAGGESGPGARPMHPDWARSLRDQCASAGVPFLFKQHGEWLPVGKEPGEAQRLILEHARPQARCYSWPDGETLVHVGKKTAGRLLDGCEWNEVPW